MSTDTWPPALTINHEAILRLFTGETFYSSVDASIREAVLNAIDAVGRRRAADSSLPPQIAVTFDTQSRTVTVTDNGDGMCQDDVTGLFARIGSSAAKIAAAPRNRQYRAVGEFGIGVLSYFLCCQHFELHSFCPGNEPIGLEFSRNMLDGRTPSRSLPPRQTTQGTELVLSVEREDHFDSPPKQIPPLDTPCRRTFCKRVPVGHTTSSRRTKPRNQAGRCTHATLDSRSCHRSTRTIRLLGEFRRFCSCRCSLPRGLRRAADYS